MQKKQFTQIYEAEPQKEGYGPARRVYTGTGPIPELPAGVTNLYENFMHGLKASQNKPMMGHRVIKDKVAGPYVWQTYGEINIRVKNLGSALTTLGLNENDNVSLFSINRPDWVIAELACFTQGFVTVPLYDTLGLEAMSYILNLTETRVIVCSGDKVKKIIGFAKDIPHIKHIISMDSVSQELIDEATAHGVTLHYMGNLEKEGAAKPVEVKKVSTDALATLCFTSGTTGVPKGVMLTHGNLLAFPAGAVEMTKNGHMYDFTNKDVHLSYLPLAHIFERVVLATLIYHGASFGFYQGDTLKLMDDAQELQPTVFVSVPRLYNKIYEKVMAGVKAKGGVAESLFNMGLEAKKANLKYGEVTHWLWDRLVFNKIKARLGGRVKLLMSGAAPISGEVLEFLKCGFSAKVVEGYGQTENCAAATNHIYVDPTVGHIGVPNPTVLVRLRDVPEMNYFSTDKPHPRGEICIKGPGVFKGYYKSPEKTAEALTEDGWLLSGDIGKWDEHGRLQIIDRVKNIFKLAQGEYIAPDKIETVYTTCDIISQVFVYGDSLQSTLVGIVVPEPEALAELAASLGIQDKTYEKLCALPELAKAVQKRLDQHGRQNGLAGFENVKSVYLESEPFSPENGLMSPTFKFKRHEGKIKYQAQIDAMYEIINQ